MEQRKMKQLSILTVVLLTLSGCADINNIINKNKAESIPISQSRQRFNLEKYYGGKLLIMFHIANGKILIDDIYPYYNGKSSYLLSRLEKHINQYPSADCIGLNKESYRYNNCMGRDFITDSILTTNSEQVMRRHIATKSAYFTRTEKPLIEEKGIYFNPQELENYAPTIEDAAVKAFNRELKGDQIGPLIFTLSYNYDAANAVVNRLKRLKNPQDFYNQLVAKYGKEITDDSIQTAFIRGGGNFQQYADFIQNIRGDTEKLRKDIMKQYKRENPTSQVYFEKGEDLSYYNFDNTALYQHILKGKLRSISFEKDKNKYKLVFRDNNYYQYRTTESYANCDKIAENTYTKEISYVDIIVNMSESAKSRSKNVTVSNYLCKIPSLAQKAMIDLLNRMKPNENAEFQKEANKMISFIKQGKYTMSGETGLSYNHNTESMGGVMSIKGNQKDGYKVLCKNPAGHGTITYGEMTKEYLAIGGFKQPRYFKELALAESHICE